GAAYGHDDIVERERFEKESAGIPPDRLDGVFGTMGYVNCFELAGAAVKKWRDGVFGDGGVEKNQRRVEVFDEPARIAEISGFALDGDFRKPRKEALPQVGRCGWIPLYYNRVNFHSGVVNCEYRGTGMSCPCCPPLPLD